VGTKYEFRLTGRIWNLDSSTEYMPCFPDVLRWSMATRLRSARPYGRRIARECVQPFLYACQRLLLRRIESSLVPMSRQLRRRPRVSAAAHACAKHLVTGIPLIHNNMIGRQSSAIDLLQRNQIRSQQEHRVCFKNSQPCSIHVQLHL
jgi:hypothetical protein